ncbi:MAG TPA: hypothetical protein VGM90_29695 [Kofleriaceae bacterium]|jgi:hypothetical protein
MRELTPKTLPTFRALVVTEQPNGFAIAPRGAAGDLWIEAIVWVLAGLGAGAGIWFGGSATRVICAVVVVGVAARAIGRVFKALFGGQMRTLRVITAGPTPALRGLLESVTVADFVSMAVMTKGSGTYLTATTRSGHEATLVDLDPANADDYKALASWFADS